MSFETVLYEKKENIVTITMNRPDKRNALNAQLLNDIDAAFNQAELDDDCRVVIFTGAGPSFSAGYDLKGSPYTSVPEGYTEWTPSNALRTIRKISERYKMIMYFPKPTIAKVQGYCVAAGCYLQMCCDVAIAAENAVFGHPATRGGGVTSMPLWVTYLGVRKAKELLFTSKLIGGKEAEKIGLINYCVPPEKLDEEVWKVAKLMAEPPLDGMATLKESMNQHMRILGLDAEFALHKELNALGRTMRSRGSGGLNLEALKARAHAGEQQK
jgi:enoyl-CoA hydratase